MLDIESVIEVKDSQMDSSKARMSMSECERQVKNVRSQDSTVLEVPLNR